MTRVSILILLTILVPSGSTLPASLFSATAQQLQQLGLDTQPLPQPLPALPVAPAQYLFSPYNVEYESEDADLSSLGANNVTLEESELNDDDAASIASEKYNQQGKQEETPTNGGNSQGAPITPQLAKFMNNVTSNLIFGGAGGRKSHIIRWPNAQSSTVQSCDDGSSELKCEDENAVCKLGGCVCKLGFFLHRQSGSCQSISDLLKNCENDYQCQAFNVDMICDTKSHERPFCDCTEGLYYDQETHNCLPCLRPSPITTTYPPATSSGTSLSTTIAISKNSTDNDDQLQATSTMSSGGGSATAEDNISSNVAPNYGSNSNTIRFPTPRLCKPNDLIRLGGRRRYPVNSGMGLSPYDRQLYEQTIRGPSMPPVSTTTSTIASSSDPFRIRTPLEVFMGAIMLFTLFTVAWFFLQRMIHDCRAILRSLRNPDFGANNSNGGIGGGGGGSGIGGGCTEQSFISGAGSLSNFTSGRPGAVNHHYFDPTGQAVARLFSGDGLNGVNAFSGLTSSIYQRDLAGVMVQHLAANLSPSSTSQALANGNSARALGLGNNEHDAALYPLTASAQQSRTAAAAAAAQLLLSPTHPAIAILRAAAAAQNPGVDYASANILNSMFDPPPKYEEAIAQFDYQQMPPNQPHSQPLQTVVATDSSGPPQLDQPGQPATVATAPTPSDQTSGDDEIHTGETGNLEGPRSDRRDVNNVLSIYIPPQLDNEQQASAGGNDLLAYSGSGGDLNNQTGAPTQAARDEVANQQPRRESLSERRSSRRSRRSRGSITRFQQKTQDSD